jgi:hypothetical protein
MYQSEADLLFRDSVRWRFVGGTIEIVYLTVGAVL